MDSSTMIRSGCLIKALWRDLFEECFGIPREDVIYKVALKDPNMVFKIIVKDHR